MDGEMTTPIDGKIEQKGELALTSPAFEDGEMMPDSVGYANENENPPLHISGVPDGAEALVLAMDDPEAEPVVGHIWDHWMVFDINSETAEIPEAWTPDSAVEAYNDFVETGWGGPSPPEGDHAYYFKLFALDSKVGYPPAIRKARLGSVMATECEILAQTQLVGRYDAEQGTIF
ncbi:YbhB/YbcL family Raf kinase inhibitor-like protein [Halorarum salinum]|uniref:YbhB/YbcL family Raf kinase inhibitor-like protein n=1 Tax=Halorarum salinum TaxID=2743089 RepID=A0A7D5QB27_9EURY|nr:YbhB/YbcL family Raf kinase inhibitor-like protein [Halobaculum salinum]QLG61919.1 YbhB/YbcL family Raf kinase inhibitor-like protein [Halobaculum salinum]